MFTLKKVLSLFLMPTAIALLAALALWYLLLKKSYKKAQALVWVVIAWLFLISYHPVAYMLLSPLEKQYEKLSTMPADVEYLLFLGGDTKGRLYEVLRLYQINPKLKLITSGYEPYGGNGAVEAAAMLTASGIPKEAILIRPHSKDTKEEVAMMQKLVGTQPFLLVTSAYHMPRAMAIFHKNGLNPVAAPTDFFAHKPHYFPRLEGANIEAVDSALHEYIGLLWYWIKGDI